MCRLLAVTLLNFNQIPQRKRQLQRFLYSHPKKFQFPMFADDIRHKDLKLKCFGGDLTKAAVTVVCIGRFNRNLVPGTLIANK